MQFSLFSYLHPLLFLGLVLLTPSSIAMATNKPIEIEEVIIYGQKIPRSLQDSQASIKVITADEIQKKELRSFRDVFRLTANVTDSDWIDSGFIIRGVNSEGLTPGGSPLATLYIDGAAQTVQGARRGARGLWDVAQVEVYRGPQSTLSGRSSLAGAIYINTKEPSYGADLSARATIGENRTKDIAIAGGNSIINDVLAFRVAGEYQTAKSDLNYPNYKRYNKYNDFTENTYYQLRAKLLFEPEFLNSGRALLSASTSHDSPILDDIAGPALGFAYSDRRGDLNTDTPFFQEARKSSNDNYILDISYPLTSQTKLTSITSYSDTEVKRPSINAGTEGEIDVSNGTIKESFATQEFRLNYNGDTLNWVAGLYLSKEKSSNQWQRTILAFGRALEVSRAYTDTRSIALFGELEYEFTPSWTVVAGGRFSTEDQEYTSFFSRDLTYLPENPDIITNPTPFDSSEDVFLPKLGINYQLSSEQNIGFTYSTGYRSGGSGFNSASLESYEFDSEFLYNYELSYKGTFLNNRLQLNTNVFYGDWDDQQVEIQEDPQDFTTTRIENAAESSLYGVELEAKYQLNATLSGFASLGYTKTEFEKFDESSTIDFSGMPFPQSPEKTASIGLDYSSDLGIVAGIDISYVDDFLARDYQNLPIDKVGNYTLVNLRLGYDIKHWAFTLFADNLFNKDYFVYQDIIEGFGDCCATLGKRRFVGFSVRWDMN